MLSVDIRDNLREVVAQLTEVEKEHLPIAQAVAMTRTARTALKVIVSALPMYIDKPTRWALGAFYVRPATKKRLLAEVLSRQWAAKTTGVGMMRHHVEGGDRKVKASERRLQDLGFLPGGMLTVMGRTSDVPKDGYGNIPAARYVAMLAKLGALGDQSATGAVSARRKGRYAADTYFVATGKGRSAHLQPGIYQRGGQGRFDQELLPVLLFVKGAKYKPVIPLQMICDRVSAENLLPQFVAALDGALKSARGGPVKSAFVESLKTQHQGWGERFSMAGTTRADSNWGGSVAAGMER